VSGSVSGSAHTEKSEPIELSDATKSEAAEEEEESGEDSREEEEEESESVVDGSQDVFQEHFTEHSEQLRLRRKTVSELR
jgi:hypothetical protein